MSVTMTVKQKQNNIVATLERTSGKFLDFLYGSEEKTRRTLGLAFLAMAFSVILHSAATATTCGI